MDYFSISLKLWKNIKEENLNHKFCVNQMLTIWNVKLGVLVPQIQDLLGGALTPVHIHCCVCGLKFARRSQRLIWVYE